VIGLNHEFYKNIVSKISFTISAIFFFIALNYVIIPFYSDGLVTNTYELFWMRPQVIVYATVFIFIAFKFKNELNLKNIPNLPFMLLKELGKNSFGIYLSHILILDVLLGLLNLLSIEINDFINNIFIFLIVLFMSLTFVRLINRMPFGRFIVGEAR
jgi:peptidoglycan/LPS O-acetylase OafA/YrhL